MTVSPLRSAAAMGVTGLVLAVGSAGAAPPQESIAYASTNGCDTSSDVFVAHADGSNAQRITHTCLDSEPAWSPDGTQIAFSSKRDGNPQLFVMNADGSGTHPVTPSGVWASRPDWSRQGMLAFSDLAGGIDTIAPDGTRLTRVTSIGREPSWSADGAWIAYTYDDASTSYRDTIAIVAAGGGASTNVAADAMDPAFSPDGSRLAWAGRDPSTGSPTLVVADENGAGAHVIATFPLATTYDLAPAWAPDSGSLMFRSGPTDDLYRIAASGGPITRMTVTAAVESYPSWQPVVPSTGFELARIAFRQGACSTKPGAATVAVADAQGRPLAGAVVMAPGTRAVTTRSGVATLHPRPASRRGRLAFTVRAVLAGRPAASRHVSLPDCR